MAATITGDKKLDRKLKRLGDKVVKKVSAQGIRAGLRVIVKGIKSEIPSHMKSARKSVSSRFAKAKGGANKGIVQAKAGNVGPQIKKGTREFIGAAKDRSGKPGVGISRRNLVWILKGTKQRVQKTTGRSTGVMPGIAAVPRGFAKSEAAATQKIKETIRKGIDREAAKK